jgi:hypothetical protein
MPVQEAIQRAPVINSNGHNGQCDCAECLTLVKGLFKAFHIEKRTSKNYKRMECPKCKRPLYPRGRGPWSLWECWCDTFEEAQVTAFKDDQECEYGFAEGLNKNIFIHLNKRMEVVCDGDDWLKLYEPGSLIRPKRGDSIIYHGIPGKKGIKALWWAFWHEYQEAKEALAKRPEYRFIERDGRVSVSRLDAKPQRRVRWEGKNTYQLGFEFSKEAFPCYSTEFKAYYFERLGDDGRWLECVDPR